MTALANTLIRSLNKDKELILMMLKELGEGYSKVEYTIKLHADEGEVLITLIMTDEQVEQAVQEAVSEVFPNKKSSNVFVKNEYIKFTIE